MFRRARHRLRTELGLYAGDPVALADSGVDFEMVNVTLSYEGKLLASQGAKAATLTEALDAAMARAVGDKRFGGYMMASQAERTHIELLIQQSSERIDNSSLKAVERSLAWGVDGIELWDGPRRTYFKPGVPLTKRWKNHKAMLRRLCRKAKLDDDAWMDPKMLLRRTTWLHYAEAPDRRAAPVELYRNRLRRVRPLDRDTVLDALVTCANRLAGSQRSDGAFSYIYDPVAAEVSDEKFNMVRMCGCTYAMARTASHLPTGLDRQRFITAADRALGYVLARGSEPVELPGAMFIAERKSGRRRAYGKLGATALALMALEFQPFRSRYDEERARLVDCLLERQRDDGRWLTNHYSNEWSEGLKPEKETSQNFFPGETLLALVNEWLHTREPRILEAIRRAFPVYRDHFRAGETTAFVLWQVDAWRQLAEAFLSDASDAVDDAEVHEWVDFVFEVIDWVLHKQFTPQNAPFEDYLGGFFAPKPPRMATTVIGEAVIRATGLAQQVGDMERTHRYRDASLSALRFSFRLQIEEAEAFRLPHPELCIGGISGNLTDLTIRNDHDQHAITMWIAALETPALGL